MHCSGVDVLKTPSANELALSQPFDSRCCWCWLVMSFAVSVGLLDYVQSYYCQDFGFLSFVMRPRGLMDLGIKLRGISFVWSILSFFMSWWFVWIRQLPFHLWVEA